MIDKLRYISDIGMFEFTNADLPNKRFLDFKVTNVYQSIVLADTSCINVIKGENTRYGRTCDKVQMTPGAMAQYIQWYDDSLVIEFKQLCENLSIQQDIVYTSVIKPEILWMCEFEKALRHVGMNPIRQFPVSKYTVDMIVINKIDDSLVCVDIIEYDEAYHDLRLSEDIEREFAIANEMRSEFEVIGATNVSVKFNRIRAGEEYKFMCGIIGCIAGYHDSYAFDKDEEISFYAYDSLDGFDDKYKHLQRQ